ncbi:hypothetical protein COU38_00105, partial [Candidatus Micrarchaeota archaeon CG10_big_fil_rev_8_21_14_0_10_54_18]
IGFENFQARTSTHDFQTKGCILTMAGFLLCLDEDESWAVDDITGVYGWRQTYSLWTPAGEKKGGEFKWEKEGWRMVLSYASLIGAASSGGDLIGSIIGAFGGKNFASAGGDVGNILTAVNTFGFGSGGESIIGAGLRGAVQGGLTGAAHSYGNCKFGNILATAGIQAGGAIIGQTIKVAATGGFAKQTTDLSTAKFYDSTTGYTYSDDCPTSIKCVVVPRNTDGNPINPEVTIKTINALKRKNVAAKSEWQGLWTTIGSGIDLGAFAINRWAIDYSSEDCKEVCLAQDVMLVSRADDVTGAIAADYDLTPCRQPSLRNAEVREK